MPWFPPGKQKIQLGELNELGVENSHFLAVRAQQIFFLFFITVIPRKYDQMSRHVYYAKNMVYFSGSGERDHHCNLTSFAVAVGAVPLKVP